MLFMKRFVHNVTNSDELILAPVILKRLWLTILEPMMHALSLVWGLLLVYALVIIFFILNRECTRNLIIF